MIFINKKTGKTEEWDCIDINSSLVSAQSRKIDVVAGILKRIKSKDNEN